MKPTFVVGVLFRTIGLAGAREGRPAPSGKLGSFCAFGLRRGPPALDSPRPFLGAQGELALFDAHDKSRLHAARVSPEP